MQTFTIEEYYNIIRLETNKWLSCIDSIMRTISKEVMDHPIKSIIYDSKDATMNIDVPFNEYTIHMRGRGYLFKNSRSYIITFRGIDILNIKVNGRRGYCTVENCRLNKSLYTNGIIRNIDTVQVLAHMLGLIDEINEKYPDITIVTQEERAELIKLSRLINNLLSITVKA